MFYVYKAVYFIKNSYGLRMSFLNFIDYKSFSETFFLKKVYKNKGTRKVNLFSFLSNFSISNPINTLKKTWSSNVLFLINHRFVNFFDSINKNRLKNIFYRVIPNSKVWNEISSMLDNGILNIRSDYFYSNDFSPLFDFLSFLLFNIYILEFDFYILNLISILSSRKIVMKLKNLEFLNIQINRKVSSPLKISTSKINLPFNIPKNFFLSINNKRDLQEYDL